MKHFAAFLAIFLLSLTFVSAESWSTSDSDLYQVAENISLLPAPSSEDPDLPQEEIREDAFLLGHTIEVLSPLKGDLLATGVNILLLEEVKDDVRLLGGNISLQKNIGGHVILVGKTLLLQHTALVSGDFIAFGETVTINGDVLGNLTVRAQKLIINGVILGNANITVNTLTFGKQGKIEGNAKVKSSFSPQQQFIEGTLSFEQQEPKKEIPSYIPSFLDIFCLLSSIVLGMLFLLASPHFFSSLALHTANAPFRHLGIGFLFLLAFPFVVALLFATLLGIPLGIVLLFAFPLALLFSHIFAGFFVGRLLLLKKTKKGYWFSAGSFALGTVFVFLIGLLPFIGGVFQFLILLTALGGIFTEKMRLVSFLRNQKKI